jgi:hypothetical protein
VPLGVNVPTDNYMTHFGVWLFFVVRWPLFVSMDISQGVCEVQRVLFVVIPTSGGPLVSKFELWWGVSFSRYKRAREGPQSQLVPCSIDRVL